MVLTVQHVKGGHCVSLGKQGMPLGILSVVCGEKRTHTSIQFWKGRPLKGYIICCFFETGWWSTGVKGVGL